MHVHIGGSHDVHADSKGHSGLLVMMGTCAMINASKKLGVGTVSSTETEVGSTGHRFAKCTWLRYFRNAQGYDSSKKDILLQDGQSCILLHKIIHSLT